MGFANAFGQMMAGAIQGGSKVQQDIAKEEAYGYGGEKPLIIYNQSTGTLRFVSKPETDGELQLNPGEIILSSTGRTPSPYQPESPIASPASEGSGLRVRSLFAQPNQNQPQPVKSSAPISAKQDYTADIQGATDAIRRGADPVKVKMRLKELGVPDSALSTLR